MQALVFGCGYLGRRVACGWRDAGFEVHAVTRSGERAESFRDDRLQPVIADVTDPGSLGDLPDAELVLYAVGRDRNSTRPPETLTLGGLRNVMSALAGSVRRFVYVSSSSVYGQSAGEWVDEDSACEPVRDNGRLCLEAEQLAREHDGAVVVRLTGLYGPGRLVARIDRLRAGEPLAGRPDAWLNLIHVDDAARAVVAIAERADDATTWLVTDDRPVRRSDYFTRLAELIGAPPPSFDTTHESPRTSGLNKRCRNRALREQLGVELEFPTFDEGLPNAVGSE